MFTIKYFVVSSVILFLADVRVQVTGKSLLLNQCNSTTDCPEYSNCTERDCDGKLCLCQLGFIPTKDLTTCVEAVELGNNCTGNRRCKDIYSHCDAATHTCICPSGYTVSSDGNHCKPLPPRDEVVDLLGEICDNNKYHCYDSVYLKCVNGTCQCKEGYRNATPEELNAEPFKNFQCRINSYSLGTPVNKSLCPTPSPVPSSYEFSSAGAHSPTPLSILEPSQSQHTHYLTDSLLYTVDSTPYSVKTSEIVPSTSEILPTPASETRSLDLMSSTVTVDSSLSYFPSVSTINSLTTGITAITSSRSEHETVEPTVQTETSTAYTTALNIYSSTMSDLISSASINPSKTGPGSTISETFHVNPTVYIQSSTIYLSPSTSHGVHLSTVEPSHQTSTMDIKHGTSINATNSYPGIISSPTHKATASSSHVIASTSIVTNVHTVMISSSQSVDTTLATTDSSTLTSKTTSASQLSTSTPTSTTKISTTTFTTEPSTKNTKVPVIIGSLCNSTATVCVSISHAVCEDDSCNIPRCRCMSGYGPSEDMRSCLKIVGLGEPCNENTTCDGMFAVCASNRHCTCQGDYEGSSNGRWCRMRESWFVNAPLLGEKCSSSFFVFECYNVFEQECHAGSCHCKEDLREATDDDQKNWYKDPSQCRNASLPSGEREPELCQGQIRVRVDANDLENRFRSKVRKMQGIIIGTSVGAVAALGIVVGVVFVVRRKKHEGKTSMRDSTSEASLEGTRSRYSFRIPRPFSLFMSDKDYEADQISYHNSVFEGEHNGSQSDTIRPILSNNR